MSGPLVGLTVIEFAGLGPCPLAGQLLADLGARVTVIDRASKPFDKTDINRRGKRSIALNLKSDAGRNLAARMITKADVLLEGFRPGVMERLGLGPERFCVDNPLLVYGRVTGWGQTGELSKTAGHDINYLAITGALAAIGPQHSVPMPPLNLVADYAGGSLFLVYGVMAALYERQHSGRGQVVDAAMVDGVPAIMGLLHQWVAQGQWRLQRESNWLDGGAPFYRCYKTKDDLYMAVGALEPQFFKLLLEQLALPIELQEQQYDRAHWARHAALLSETFAEHTQAHWRTVFHASDACVTPVLTLDTVQNHAHNKDRNTFQELNEVWQASPAPRFERTACDHITAPAPPGGHTDIILKELGLSGDEIQSLHDSNVLT